MVGINHQYAVRLAFRLGSQNTLIDFIFEIAAVKQRSQRIANGLVFEQDFSVFARCDVLKSRIQSNIVVIVDDVGRGQQPERRVPARGFDQNFKILNLAFLLQTLV